MCHFPGQDLTSWATLTTAAARSRQPDQGQRGVSAPARGVQTHRRIMKHEQYALFATETNADASIHAIYAAEVDPDREPPSRFERAPSGSSVVPRTP